MASLGLLLRGGTRWARPFAMAAVATVVIGWGVAQWPYMLPTSLEVSDAAAPDPTLATILVVFVAAAVLILPSLALLYYLDQHSALASEGADLPGADATA
jgi:cytochrome d ubiquinol oxidase subunit II